MIVCSLTQFTNDEKCEPYLAAHSRYSFIDVIIQTCADILGYGQQMLRTTSSNPRWSVIERDQSHPGKLSTFQRDNVR